MSLYYDQRTSTLKAIYDRLQDVCQRHPAISHYDSGELQEFGGDDYTYPLAYLETINSVTETAKKTGEVYTIALNLVDRQPAAAGAELILVYDKLKQIFSEIKAYLEQKHVYGNEQVSAASILLFPDFGTDRLARLRGEFAIEVDMLKTPALELKKIFGEA